MSDIKISELDSNTSVVDEDLLVQVHDGITVKFTAGDIASYIVTSKNLADKAYVDAIVDLAPETLDTLRELALAINNDPNFAATITEAINNKIDANGWESLWSAKNTYHLPEGSNLYFTEQRVLDVVNPLLAAFTPSVGSATFETISVENIEFSGTGAVNIKSGNDLNFTAVGDITFNGDQVITKSQLKTIVAASTDFADFKARIAGL